MLATLVRFLLGFALACLAAGLTKVLFVITPADLVAVSPDLRGERLGMAGLLALAAATHSAIFAAPFAAIVAALGAWQRVRGWGYYVFAGLAISLAGFATLYASESLGQPTIANGYALAAYMFAGMIGGYVFWLVFARSGGGAERDFVSRRSVPGRDSGGETEAAVQTRAPEPAGDAAGSGPKQDAVSGSGKATGRGNGHGNVNGAKASGFSSVPDTGRRPAGGLADT